MTGDITVLFSEAAASGQGRCSKMGPGATLMEAAREGGVEITATCGGRGRCRSCRVKILRGEVPPPTIMDRVQLGLEAVQEQFRLACQTRVFSDVSVLVAPPSAEIGHQILAAGGRPLRSGALVLDSGIAKLFVTAVAPSDEHHQTSDLEEILRGTAHHDGGKIPIEVMRKAPSVLREKDGAITITTFNGDVIDIEAGDTTAHCYGMAFDIGTTSIVGSLLDLATGVELASVGGVNPQAVYGGDLMSRIAYALYDEKKLQTLRARLLGALNDFIKEAASKAGIAMRHIHKFVVVGNTCMHHIFLGIDPTWVGLAPYAPVIRAPIVATGREMLLKGVPNARVCLLPLVAGFVGADTVACVLATRIYESAEMKALVDIGTNGEVVMGCNGRLIACSAPAGPALEGAQIRHGMRGALGAIERVTIDGDVSCGVIGGVPPIGICGSGLIDAIAAMLDAKLIDASGLIRADGGDLPAELLRRLRHAEGRDQFVLVPAEDTGKNEDIVLTQSDIRQLQLAKGAICSGIVMLQHVLGVADAELTELMLCGGFGNYISTRSAVRIRLLPPLSLDRITYWGNAAALGAQMALLSETERERAAVLARDIEHVSLASHPDFQEIFVEALKFPALSAREHAEDPPEPVPALPR
jgi:uncharacterized 2Fe-2S/4Fe-4S cluster protein (DUF4445 family)